MTLETASQWRRANHKDKQITRENHGLVSASLSISVSVLIYLFDRSLFAKNKVDTRSCD